MRYYQVHKTCDGGSSAGYEWFTNKYNAEEATRTWINDYPDESATVETIDRRPSCAEAVR